MAQISDFAFSNEDYTTETEGFRSSANFPNPTTEAQTRLQLQKLLSQIRYFINNTIKPNLNGKIETSDIADNLTTDDATKVLSAKQGKVLQDSKVNTSDIVDNVTTTVADKPLSAKQGSVLKGLIDTFSQRLYTHIDAVNNPHSVTKSQVGLGNCDNTSDANKPISTATQTALNLKVNTADIKDNLTSTDTNKPLSANQGKTLKGLIDALTSLLSSHTSNSSNPHSVTKAQLGLGNVDNTSDANKPVSTAQQTALNLKENLANKVTAFSSPTNTQYPSAKLVKDQLDTKLDKLTTTGKKIYYHNGSTQGELDLTGFMEAYSVTGQNTTLGDINTLLTTINTNGEHVLFDVSSLGASMYLCTIFIGNDKYKIVDLVNGKISEGDYDSTKLLTIALTNASDIATQSQIDYLQEEIDELGGKSAIKNWDVLGDLIRDGESTDYISAGDTIDVNWISSVIGSTTHSLVVTCSDPNAFITKVGECEDKDYLFVYDGTNWEYNETAITLSEWGLSVAGTIPTGEVMTIHTTPNKVKYTFTGYDDMTAHNSAVPHNWVLEQTYAPTTKCYDTYESAFNLAVGNTIPAGDYYVSAPYYSGQANVTYYFTIPSAITADSVVIQFASLGYQNVNSKYLPSKIRPANYGTNTYVASEIVCSTTEISGATDISTITGVSVNQSVVQTAFGNGCWEYSNLRQWLNDSNQVAQFTPKTEFDRPATYNLSGNGFLYGLDPRVKAILLECDDKYTAGYDNKDRTRGTIYTVTDKAFLLSMKEMSFNTQTGEGNVTDLYNEYTSGVLTNDACASRAKLNKSGGTTNSYRWSRSTYSGSAHGAYSVNSTGAYGYNFAFGARYFAPAFIIGKPSTNQ